MRERVQTEGGSEREMGKRERARERGRKDTHTHTHTHTCPVV